MFQAYGLHLKELFLKDLLPLGLCDYQGSGLQRWLLSWNFCTHSNVEIELSLFDLSVFFPIFFFFNVEML